MASPLGHPRVWWPALVTALCLLSALALSSGWVGSLSRPLSIMAVVGLASFAVATTLHVSMGLGRESFALRAVGVLPLVLSIGFIVVLMLEADFHRAQVWR